MTAGKKTTGNTRANLSALFALEIEPLASIIRSNLHIEGVTMQILLHNTLCIQFHFSYPFQRSLVDVEVRNNEH